MTVSDACAAGRRSDQSGPALAAALDRLLHAEIVERLVVADEPSEISRILDRWCVEQIDLAVVTGGTGVSPRDRTPEAVRSVIEFEVPGLAEKMRQESGARFPAAYLSRQVAGVRRKTLILAIPGSPRGAVECLESAAPILAHAIDLIRGDGPAGHPRSPADSSA